MKKITKLILSTLVCSMMLCGLTACEEQKEEAKTEVPAKTETPAKTESTPTPEPNNSSEGSKEDTEETDDGWSSDKFQGPWTKTVEAEPQENVRPDWMGKRWVSEDEYAVLYENEQGTVLAIFNKADDLLIEFDQTENGDHVWKCDWPVTDVREEEHEFVIGYEYHDVESDTYSDPIYACWDLDFELGWPMGYYDDISDKNQQYVTVNGNTFTIVWAEKHTLTKSYYYWKRFDSTYTEVDSYGR